MADPPEVEAFNKAAKETLYRERRMAVRQLRHHEMMRYELQTWINFIDEILMEHEAE